MFTNALRAFPNFTASDIPDLFGGPEWEDRSYHHDAGPKFFNTTLGLLVFVHHPEVQQRDDDSLPRFTVMGCNGNGEIEYVDDERTEPLQTFAETVEELRDILEDFAL